MTCTEEEETRDHHFSHSHHKIKMLHMEHNDRRKAKFAGSDAYTQSTSSKLEAAIINLSVLASGRLRGTGQEF